MASDISSNERIHYGCGLTAPAGWRNFDASPSLRLIKIPVFGLILQRLGTIFPDNVQFGDITRGLPIATASARLAYCSHVLEHLPLDGLRAALCETFRILQPGGTFRLVVPDLEVIVDKYCSTPGESAAVQFMRDTLLGQETRAADIAGRLRELVGNSQHRWMWDYLGLAKELRDAKFVQIRRAQFGDNPDPAFAEVEDEDRWRGCLGIECRKPEASSNKESSQHLSDAPATANRQA